MWWWRWLEKRIRATEDPVDLCLRLVAGILGIIIGSVIGVSLAKITRALIGG